MMFFQSEPKLPNLFSADAGLLAELKRRLKPGLVEGVTDVFYSLGAKAATQLQELLLQAEATPPVHIPYDPWGRRIDTIQVSKAWEDLKAFSAKEGIVATAYEGQWGEQSRLVQAGLLYLFSASSATYSCPLAMTDAAASILIQYAFFA